MSEIPTAPASAISGAIVTQLAEWQEVSTWLEKAKVQEMQLRLALAANFFPAPKEGVNHILVPFDGRVLQLTLDHKINRKIDEAALDAVMQQLPEDSPFRSVGVLIEYKPVLVMKGFRVLPEDQARIFAQALTEKAGAPQLDAKEVKPPGEGEARPDWPATQGNTLDDDMRAEKAAEAARKAVKKTPAKSKPGKSTKPKGKKK